MRCTGMRKRTFFLLFFCFFIFSCFFMFCPRCSRSTETVEGKAFSFHNNFGRNVYINFSTFSKQFFFIFWDRLRKNRWKIVGVLDIKKKKRQRTSWSINTFGTLFFWKVFQRKCWPEKTEIQIGALPSTSTFLILLTNSLLNHNAYKISTPTSTAYAIICTIMPNGNYRFVASPQYPYLLLRYCFTDKKILTYSHCRCTGSVHRNLFIDKAPTFTILRFNPHASTDWEAYLKIFTNNVSNHSPMNYYL